MKRTPKSEVAQPKFSIGQTVYYLTWQHRACTEEERQAVECVVCTKTRRITLADGKEYTCPACVSLCHTGVDEVVVKKGTIITLNSDLSYRNDGNAKHNKKGKLTRKPTYTLSQLVQYGLQDAKRKESYKYEVPKWAYEPQTFGTFKEAVMGAAAENEKRKQNAA